MMCSNSVVPITLAESLKLDARHTHAAHCLLYSPGEEKFGLMQMRSDGKLGFPGGGVEEKMPSVGEIVKALNRELKEEINYDGDDVTLENYIFSHLHLKPMRTGEILVTHFFMKEIKSQEEFLRIEKEHTKAPYFPEESLGLFRVPFDPIEDNFFKNFDCHRFAGNAREQLYAGINLLTCNK